MALHSVILKPESRTMRDYQRDFLDFAIGRGVLRFGKFTLKSGRISPYFFNAGLFDSGAALARLGRCYAAAIVDAGLKFDPRLGTWPHSQLCERLSSSAIWVLANR